MTHIEIKGWRRRGQGQDGLTVLVPCEKDVFVPEAQGSIDTLSEEEPPNERGVGIPPEMESSDSGNFLRLNELDGG